MTLTTSWVFSLCVFLVLIGLLILLSLKREWIFAKINAFATKPPYSPPYIHKTDKGQRVSFQTWDWDGDHYKLTQYIIDDEGVLQTGKFQCEYRAVRREELTRLLRSAGCGEVVWMFPEETGFYQPIVIAKK